MTKDKCCEILVNSASSASSQIHVLAVDDCIIDRKIIHKLLKMVFYKVTVVESAAEALELLGINVDGDRPANSDCINEKKVNMIITDYCMPGISGYDLLKKLKETKGLKEIPVVMMSSEDVPERVKRCLAEGAEDFITKPLQIGDIKKLRSHIKPARPVCYSAAKRKVPSRRVRLTGKSVERRPRLSGVVSA